MAVRYDPILGKVLERELKKEEIKSLRKVMEDIQNFPDIEFATDEDIQTLFT